MNDIHVASDKFNAIIYADDTNLLSSLCSFNVNLQGNATNITELSSNINIELDNIQEWLNINRLSLNVPKTKFMIFHNYQRDVNHFIPEIRINEQLVEWVTEFNFLGLTIIYMYIYICVHSLYEFCYRSYIQRECHSVLAKLHPITFYRGMRGSWSEYHFVFSLVYQLCLALW